MGRQCNHCALRHLRREAKTNGERVTVQNSTRSLGLGGVDVYVSPKGVKLARPISDVDHEKYFRAWYMEVPDACMC